MRACDAVKRFLDGTIETDELIAAFGGIYATEALDGHEGGMELLAQLSFSTDVLWRIQRELGGLMPDGADIPQYLQAGRTEKHALRDAVRRLLAEAALEHALREVHASRTVNASS